MPTHVGVFSSMPFSFAKSRKRLLGARVPFALIVLYPLHGLWDLLHGLRRGLPFHSLPGKVRVADHSGVDGFSQHRGVYHHQYKLSSTQNSPSKPTLLGFGHSLTCLAKSGSKWLVINGIGSYPRKSKIGMLKDASPIAHSDRPFVFRTSSPPREAFRTEHSATFRNASSPVV